MSTFFGTGGQIMKLIAHRGGSFGKENSLETMIGAAKMGADGVLLNHIEMALTCRKGT